MTAPEEGAVRVNGETCRVWRKGTGARLGVLGGFGGYVAWTPFLERLASAREVIVPSLPGYPGGLGHKTLDTPLDWITATLELLEGAGLEGADLVGHGPGGGLAAEVAALARAMVNRLVLIAPLGVFDPARPVADVWAQRASELPGLLSARPDDFAGALACPDGTDEIEWRVVQTRASEAAARLLWPTCDLGRAGRSPPHRRCRPPRRLRRPRRRGGRDPVVPRVTTPARPAPSPPSPARCPSPR
jgi:pimeloyl-ACP methyl ester carboxylesterase